MRILVISDTHGDNANFFEALDKAGKVDMVIHCGDVYGSEYVYEQAAGCPVVMVAGNNDYGYGLKSEEMIEVEGLKIWITHGHRYRVYFGSEMLIQEAYSKGADVVFYGHTHVPAVTFDPDYKVYAVNPGSLSYPRQTGYKPSYIIMEKETGKEPKFLLKFL